MKSVIHFQIIRLGFTKRILIHTFRSKKIKMSNTEEEFFREDQDVRTVLDDESNYTSRYVGEGRFIEDGNEDSSKNSLVKQVGKIFNFGALASKKRGSASINKRGSSIKKPSSRKSQSSG